MYLNDDDIYKFLTYRFYAMQQVAICAPQYVARGESTNYIYTHNQIYVGST